MENDFRSRIDPESSRVNDSTSYDPIVKLMAEQQVFNDVWIGRKPQRGWLQRVGFLTLSLPFAAAGIWGVLNTLLAAKQGAVYLFLVFLGMFILGVLGTVKALKH